MNEEYTYDIGKYTIGVDTNGEDGIGLTVAIINDNGEIHFLGNCYGDNARCIDLLIKENKQLKGSLQTHEILLKANVEENQRLKEQLEKERNTMESLKVLIKKVEQMRKVCYSYEQYREYWKKVLETLDCKGE